MKHQLAVGDKVTLPKGAVWHLFPGAVSNGGFGDANSPYGIVVKLYEEGGRQFAYVELKDHQGRNSGLQGCLVDSLVLWDTQS